MKRIVLILFLFLFPFVGNSQQILRGEYFFDTDPGIGLGTPLTVSSPADSVEINFSASVGSLGIGLHNLYVRMLNDSGVWSLTENRLINIYKANAIASIVASEYFFDTDPGIGLGTAISVGTAGDSVEFSTAISVGSLSAGLHNLYFRTKNTDGIWSLSENRLVNVYKATSNSNIVSAEYFFDTDPGVGLATALSTGTASDSVEFTSIIAPGSIGLGLHNLYIRTKNADGVWSMSENRLVNVYKTGNNTIVWSEYFFNTDPGVGNGIGAAVVPPADSVEINTSASIIGLPLGANTIYMRTKNADGVWSLSEGRVFNGCDTIGEITTITGDTLLAACVNQNGITYTIDTVLNADYYVWILPPGATVVNGDSTTSITVNYSAYSSSGFVSVAGGYSGCTGVFTSLHVNFKPIPVVEICAVTIDSLTQESLIEWRQATESYVDFYVVYRETPNLSGNYLALDSIPRSSFSSYLDTGSNPSLHPEKYKIAVLDSCGNIGDLSAPFEHQTIRLYGSLQPGGIAKLYWTDYVGINDSNRYYNVLRDNSGTGAFLPIASNLPKSTLNYTDISSNSFPNSRYLIEMFSDSTCNGSLRILASRSTSRSNIKNRLLLVDSTTVGTTESIFKNSGFKIYPNPAKELVNIVLKGVVLTYEVSVLDALGKVVLTSVSSNYKNESIVQLPLTGIASGLYFVKIKTPEMEFVSKLRVE